MAMIDIGPDTFVLPGKEYRRLLAIEAGQPAQPIAWIFELASFRDRSTGEHSGFREMIQVGRPHVPEGSIRNLRPLYAGTMSSVEVRA